MTNQQYISSILQQNLIDNVTQQITPAIMRSVLEALNAGKADLVNGKLLVEQFPDDLGTVSEWADLEGLPEENTDLVAFVNQKVSQAVTGLINSSPALLDTLSELAAALGNDPNFATTVMQAIGERLKIADFQSFQTSNTQALAGKEDKNQKGVANGYASLGSNGKVPAAQLPDAPPATTSGIPPYNNTATYQTGDQATYGGRIFESRTDNNTGNQPPSDPAVSENTHWRELSKTHLQNTDTAGRLTSGTAVLFQTLFDLKQKITAGLYDTAAMGVYQAGVTQWNQLLGYHGRDIAAAIKYPTAVAPQTGTAVDFSQPFQQRTISNVQLSISSFSNTRLGASVRLALTSQNAADTFAVSVPGWTPRDIGFRFVANTLNIVELRVVDTTTFELFINPVV